MDIRCQLHVLQQIFVQERAKLFHFIAAKSRYDTLQLCPLSILKAVVVFTSKFNFEP